MSNKVEVSLSEKTEKTILNIVEQAQANANAATELTKQTLITTKFIGFLMVCATIAPFIYELMKSM